MLAKRVCALALLLFGCSAVVRATFSNDLGDFFIPAHGSSPNPIADLPATCAQLKAEIDAQWCASQHTCFADANARRLAISGPVSPTVNVTVTKINGLGLAFQATGFVLATSQGGPGTSRGLIWLPETGFEATAYAPYASAVSRIGHYVIVLDNTTGLSDEALFGKVGKAIQGRPNLRWAIAGHGSGGSAAARIAAIDSRFRGVGLFGADLPDDVNLRDLGISVVVVYGLQDTVVTPARVRQYLASSRVPFDAYVIAQNVSHQDFAFSTCLGNSFSQEKAGFSELHFLEPELPVFSMPPVSYQYRGVVVNPTNPIVDDAAGVIPRIDRYCSAENTEAYDPVTNTWTSTDNNGRQLDRFLTARATGEDKVLALEARPSRNGYADAVAFLENKRVRTTFLCRPFVDCPLGVEFFISSSPANFTVETSLAVNFQGTNTNPGTTAALSNLMGTLGFRAATRRALSFTNNAFLAPPGSFNASKIYPANAFGPVEYYSMEVPTGNPNNPIPAKWHIFRPKRGETGTPKGGLVYVSGGSVEPIAYAPLWFEIAARGYVVVGVTPFIRAAIINTTLPLAVITNPEFSDVASNKWAVAGHSLGGAGAASYAWSRWVSPANVVGRPQVVIMHAGGIIPPTNFATLAANVPVHQIYGTLDDVGAGGFDRYRTSILPFTKPGSTFFTYVDGANHFQVGDYGYQDPDSIATISQEQQQSTFAQLTVNAMVAAGLA